MQKIADNFKGNNKSFHVELVDPVLPYKCAPLHPIRLPTDDYIYRPSQDLPKVIKERIKRPIIVGSGPAGLFIAYTCAKHGLVLFQ